ncbi:MAG: DMT family transporter [Terriglobales bacterium]
MSRSLKAHILLILTTLVWGATFAEIKDVLDRGLTSAMLFNAVRMAFAAFALGLVFLLRGKLRGISAATVRDGIIAGAFLWAGYEFQTQGLIYTTPSKSAFLTGVSVVLVPIFLVLFWRKKTNRWTLIGVAAAFVGLFLLTVPAEAGKPLGDFASVNRGDLLTLGCAISFGFQIIFLGHATRRHPFEQIAFLQTITAATLMFISTPVIEHPHVEFTPRLITAIVITGLLGTGAAFTVQAWAQQFMAATNTALIFALEPVFAWITSFIIYGERLGWRAGAGAVLILAGILTSELLGHPIESEGASLATTGHTIGTQ